MGGNKRSARAVVEAAAWRTHFTETGAESSAEFEQWLSLDPAHGAAWRGVQAPWEFITQQANSPEALEWRRIALADARSASRRRMKAAGPRPWMRYGLAAGVAVVCAAALALWMATRSDVFSTGTGERRVVTLNDGSRLTLDARTRVKVSYSDALRKLELVQGQARFDVAHEAGRPFTVHAHGQKVVALGTAFDVDRLAGRTRITLISGRVAVVNAAAKQEIELKPGEQLVADGDTVMVNTVNLELVTAWQNGQLAFDNEPLAAVVERMNRYSARRIAVADARAGELSVSGVFNAGDVDGFVSTVTHYLPLQAQAGRGGRVVLRSR